MCAERRDAAVRAWPDAAWRAWRPDPGAGEPRGGLRAVRRAVGQLETERPEKTWAVGGRWAFGARRAAAARAHRERRTKSASVDAGPREPGRAWVRWEAVWLPRVSGVLARRPRRADAWWTQPEERAARPRAEAVAPWAPPASGAARARLRRAVDESVCRWPTADGWAPCRLHPQGAVRVLPRAPSQCSQGERLRPGLPLAWPARTAPSIRRAVRARPHARLRSRALRLPGRRPARRIRKAVAA